MRVTTKGRYALRAMIHLTLSGGEKPLSIKKITEVEKLSPIFLEQIFTKLKKAHLVESVRGAGGGFLLARSASGISVKDILEAVEEGIRLAPCCKSESVEAENCEHQDDCHATDFWQDANEYLMRFFESYTLDRIIKEYSKTDKFFAIGTV